MDEEKLERTLRFLEAQKVPADFCDSREYRTLKAIHKMEDHLMVKMLYSYLLGIVCGKREDRSRRKKSMEVSR